MTGHENYQRDLSSAFEEAKASIVVIEQSFHRWMKFVVIISLISLIVPAFQVFQIASSTYFQKQSSFSVPQMGDTAAGSSGEVVINDD